MPNVVQYAEEVIYDWLILLHSDELKTIETSNDIFFAITDDVEEEIKNDVWNVIKNQLSFSAILLNIKLYLANQSEEDSSDEE